MLPVTHNPLPLLCLPPHNLGDRKVILYAANACILWLDFVHQYTSVVTYWIYLDPGLRIDLPNTAAVSSVVSSFKQTLISNLTVQVLCLGSAVFFP